MFSYSNLTEKKKKATLMFYGQFQEVIILDKQK